MFVLVVGGGKIGYYLIKDLLNSEQEVVIIEKNKVKCASLSESLGSIVIYGDGCDPRILEQAGAERADAVVAVTGDDEDNLIVCQVAKNKFNVPFTISIVNNSKNEEIFKKLGIDATISSTNLILSLIEQEVTYKGILTFFPIEFRKGGLKIVETLITPKSPAANKAIKNLNTPSEYLIVGVIRNEELSIPDGNFVLQPNDMIISITKKEKIDSLKKLLIG